MWRELHICCKLQHNGTANFFVERAEIRLCHAAKKETDEFWKEEKLLYPWEPLIVVPYLKDVQAFPILARNKNPWSIHKTE